jgi:bifunctional DNA-binding transcriptional regulator/antitoxin component of YhaV-PrlF toxin-antitoxin module
MHIRIYVCCTGTGVDMRTLTVTARGQVTFRRGVLQHLGIRPGEKIELDLLPNGRAELRAARAKGSFRDLHGFLKGKMTCRYGRLAAQSQPSKFASVGNRTTSFRVTSPATAFDTVSGTSCRKGLCHQA